MGNQGDLLIAFLFHEQPGDLFFAFAEVVLFQGFYSLALIPLPID